MPRAPDDDAELLRQVRKLVGATDERLLKWEVDRYIRAAALPLEGPLKNPKKLSRVIKDCRRALQSIETIGGHESFMIRVELANFIRLCEQVVSELPAAKRSGGDPSLPIRERLTVEIAVELILNCGECTPTVDLVSEVAAKLFELSMEEEPSNMDDYASELFKRMERDGYPDARARRRLDAEGKKAAREWLKANLRDYGTLWRGPVKITDTIPDIDIDSEIDSEIDSVSLADAVPANERRARRAASPGQRRKTRGGARHGRARR